LENSNRSVGADRLLDIARVLGVSLDYLMKGEPDASVQLQVTIPQRLSEFAKRESPRLITLSLYSKCVAK
jgi:transcriptional regulator with XRE-family HTH domain